MRDCLFLVADKSIEAMIAGFLSSDNFHLKIGCNYFKFEQKHDLRVAHGKNDPGIYTIANELLQPYYKTHRRVIVILDAAWNGSPGAIKINEQVKNHCRNAGWNDDNHCVIVIDPELENWIWQNNINVCKELGSKDSYETLKAELVTHKFWLREHSKPNQPKEAVEYILKKNRIPVSAALYKNIAMKVTTKNCTDAAFLKLKTTLIQWF